MSGLRSEEMPDTTGSVRGRCATTGVAGSTQALSSLRAMTMRWIWLVPS